MVFIMAFAPIEVNKTPRLSSGTCGPSDTAVRRALQKVDLCRRGRGEYADRTL